MDDPSATAQALAHFRLAGPVQHIERFGAGHIHDTWLVRCADRAYLLQRINHRVFTDVPALMNNVQRVSQHVAERGRAAGLADAARRALTLVPTRDGDFVHRDPQEAWWRVFDHIPNSCSFDTADTPERAESAATAFGHFQVALADLPPPPLHETIPHFHDTPRRLDALVKAADGDPLNRAIEVEAELDFALRRQDLVRHLSRLHEAGRIHVRVTHNDTKLNNVLFDTHGGGALCVVDLDTVMPGLVPHDFGDLVRTGATRAAEDERDLSKVTMDLTLFAALTRGYLGATGALLNHDERAALATAGPLITLEVGMRFLTDHLLGDTYFRIHRPGQNLDRCRAQFALVSDMEKQGEAMARMVADG